MTSGPCRSDASDPGGDLAAEYSDRAEVYARCWAPVIHPMARALLDGMPLADARRVLDLGCGTGNLLPQVMAAAPSAAVIGADYAAGMLRQARRKCGGPLAVMDARRMAFPDRTFDAVVLAFVLFHVPDPATALREVRRVLRGSGTAGVVVWGEADATPWDVIWREALDAHGADPDPRDPRLMGHALMDTEEKLSGLLRSAGLDPTRGWTKRFEHVWTPEALFELHTNCSSPYRRLRTLPEAKRSACRDRVRERLFALRSEDLVYRPDIVFAVASRDS